MKKIIFSILACFTITAQAQSYQKEQVDFNLGAGLINPYFNSGNYYYPSPGWSHSSLPLFNVSGEYGITDAIGIGGYIGYSRATTSYTGIFDNGSGSYYYTDTYKWSFTVMGVRGAYHFAEMIDNDKLDVYIGGMFGFNLARGTYTSTDRYIAHNYSHPDSHVGLAYNVFAGCRYHFSEMFGVFGEVGYGVSVFNIGITYKRD
jgi:hypothetical protein